MKIGILALQGAVEPHEVKLKALGVTPVQVRTPQALEGLSGIILPGGESTTMLKLLNLNSLWEPLKRFVDDKPTWGLCAGAILLAKEVHSPSQASLGMMDIVVDRNAYGRQLQSFIAPLSPTPAWLEFAEGAAAEKSGQRTEGVFIRAPKIIRYDKPVRVLFHWKTDAVMVEEGHWLASTFHPELTDSNLLHRFFITKCGA